MPLTIRPGFTIPDTELDVTFITASGPGGQNVNKVATAAQLRFNARHSPALSDRTRAKLETIAGSRCTKDGVIVITAQRFRTQTRNRQDALERLANLIREAATREVFRVKTRPSLGEKRRRLESKAHRSRIKKGRNTRFED